MMARTAIILKRAREIINEEKEDGHEGTVSPKIYTNLQPLQEVDFNPKATDIIEEEDAHEATVSPKIYTNLQPLQEVDFNPKATDIIEEEDAHEATVSPKIYINLQPLQDISSLDGCVDKRNQIVDTEIMDDDLIHEEDMQSGREEYLKDQNVEKSSDKGIQTINEDNNNRLDVEQSHGENNEVESEEQKYQGRPKKGRKRKFPSQNRHIRKEKCIHNKTYYTQRGEVRSKKEFRQYLCKCDCLSKVGIENAREEYEKFYKVSSHDAQRALICAMVRERPIKRKRVKYSDKKMNSREYNINGNVVCKPFFLQTLRISSSKVDSALKAKKRPEGVTDLRGIRGGKNKISNERLQEIIGHIERFPKYKSHYAREKTSSMYLRPDTTLPIMYDLYKQEVNNSPVSFSKYKGVFLTHFNLKRKPLKKDTCNLCDKLDILVSNCTAEEQEKYKIERDNHIDSAEEARQTLNADRQRAKYDEKLEVLCFDMEKTLPLPRIPTNVIFYKRQLWLYNLGIHTAKNNKGHCYVWLEGEAGRGAQEVGSCLFRHCMEDRDMVACKHLILWSDSCGGQNRNIKLVLMLNAIFDAHALLERITLRFLTSGHSFLPNDADFGDIECALKLQQRIYSPADYMNVMSMCRKRNPLVVHKMGKEHFFSTANLEKKIVNRKVDVFNNKINWLKFKEIEIRKESRDKIFVKYSFHEEAREISLEKKRGRPSIETRKNFKESLMLLWPDGKPIADKKLDDIKFLLSLIPKDAKEFYKKLTGDPNIEEDIEGFNGHLDFDLEADEL